VGRTDAAGDKVSPAPAWSDANARDERVEDRRRVG
jgi:hypothetical protein